MPADGPGATPPADETAVSARGATGEATGKTALVLLAAVPPGVATGTVASGAPVAAEGGVPTTSAAAPPRK